MPPEAEDARFAVLLAAARDGEPAAWSDLYHDVASLVLGYLRAQRLDDADDVAGEVMLEMVRGIRRFRGSRQQYRSWVLTIAHHRLVDQRRHRARRPATPTPTEELEPYPAADDPATEALRGLGGLEQHLSALTEEQRTVVLLRVVAERSLKEVADIMGKRANAIKALQHRAIAALRRQLAPEDLPVGARARASGRNPDAPDSADTVT